MNPGPGSQVNIISEKTYNKMKMQKLSSTKAQLYGYSGNTIPILGMCVLPYKDHQLEFFVTSTDRSSILGYESCCELGLIKVTLAVENTSHDFAPESKGTA
jgi:hypothetical protein